MLRPFPIRFCNVFTSPKKCPNRPFCYAVFLCEHFGRNFPWNVFGLQFQNKLFRVFRSSFNNILLSCRPNVPSFFGHVLHVFKMSSRPKMAWVAADSIIARMTKFCSFWDRADQKLIRNPVSKAVVSMTPRKNTVLALDSSNSRPKPWPAFIWISLFNLAPKPFFSGNPIPLFKGSLFSPFNLLFSGRHINGLTKADA